MKRLVYATVKQDDKFSDIPAGVFKDPTRIAQGILMGSLRDYFGT